MATPLTNLTLKMNLGLGNLTTVKEHIQSPAMALETSFDGPLSMIALGVSGMFEGYTNRRFARLENDVFTVDADRLQIWLPRAPVESIASIEQQDDLDTGYYALLQNDILLNLDLRTGWLMFNGACGSVGSSIRITYTGGYYFNTSEEEDLGCPAGQTELPDDLRMAWLMQIEHIWSQRDKLGVSLAAKPGAESHVGDLQLLPMVRQILDGYRRFSP